MSTPISGLDPKLQVDDGRDEEVKSESLGKRIIRFLQFNKHTTIERLLAFTLVMISSLSVILAFSIKDYFSSGAAKMANLAVYTSQFTTSKTNNTGKVVNVYRSADHKKALVLMQFTNPAQMSSFAKNYQAWITGASSGGGLDHLGYKPSGSIYSFGNTGYLGVYLYNANGIPSHIINLTLRSATNLVNGADNADAAPSGTTTNGTDLTFQKYDQWRVFVNPGAKQAVYAPSLDAKTPSVAAMYYDIVTQQQEGTIRSTLDNDLVTLKADLASINEYTDQLSTMSVNGLHLKLPTVPAIVSGDQVTGKAGLTSGDVNQSIAGVTTAMNQNAPKDSTLAFKPKVVFANGFNFDWRDGSVLKGYLNTVVPKGQNYITWLTNHNQANPQPFDGTSIQWKMSDGTNLSDQSGSTLDALTQINQTVNLYTQAYQKYYTDKQQYEVTDLGSLLNLEVDLKQVEDNNTVNSSPNVIEFWGK